MTDLGIGEPPTLPKKEELLFPACASHRCAECIGESATQRCSCTHHIVIATDESEPLSVEPDDLDPAAERPTFDEPIEGTVTIIDGTNGTIRTEVDGQEAIIKPAPEQPPLVTVSLEDLAHDLGVIDRRIKNEQDDVNDIKATIKELNETREEILTEIKRRGQPSQLGLVLESES